MDIWRNKIVLNHISIFCELCIQKKDNPQHYPVDMLQPHEAVQLKFAHGGAILTCPKCARHLPGRREAGTRSESCRQYSARRRRTAGSRATSVWRPGPNRGERETQSINQTTQRRQSINHHTNETISQFNTYVISINQTTPWRQSANLTPMRLSINQTTPSRQSINQTTQKDAIN